MKKTLKKHEKRIGEIFGALDEKVADEEYADLKKHIMILPSDEDVQNLKAYVSDNIEAFRADNGQAKLQRAEQEAIIRRFDEVLSLKASVVTVAAFEEDMDKKISGKLDRITRDVSGAMHALEGVEAKELAWRRDLEDTMDEKIALYAKRERAKQTLEQQR